MQQQSIAGTPVHREIEGWEEIEIVVHDIEQGFIDMLATDGFKESLREALRKSGRFGSGTCFPVVYFKGHLQFKVFTSVESALSKEKMPPPFTVEIEANAGAMRPDSIEIAAAEVDVQRVTGLDVATAGDKARLEVGLTPLVPQRTSEGAIVNAPGKHEQRAADYEQRFAKSKATVLAKKEAIAAAEMSEEERERLAKEGEARNQEPESTESGANLK